MRPVRGLLACIGTLILLTITLTLRRSEVDYDGPAATKSRNSRLRALFSWHTPDSLFPPSAIISLTDDNSTFFIARPASYGPSLPSGGLSGQLWIGSGFGDDGSGQAPMNSEGELGCSDIPGWPHTGTQDGATTKSKDMSRITVGSKQSADKQPPKAPVQAIPAVTKDKAVRGPSLAPQAKDGTDDYLHWPLKGAALIKGATVPFKEKDGSKDAKDNEHADIQSLQEGAEIAGKVVLLNRGGCGFLEKTKWVQRRGGVALIVGNNVRDPNLVNMYASEDTSNVTIPSIFTSHMSAHLLSSLLPPSGFLGQASPDAAVTKPGSTSGRQTGKEASKAGKKSASSAKSGSSTRKATWLSRLANALGIRAEGGPSDDTRYPNSGRISWVQSDNWEDEVSPKQTSASKQTDVKGSESKNQKSRPSNQGQGFVIGVHDWRDPDLVALQQEQKQGTTTKSTTATSTSSVAADPKVTYAKGKTYAGGNVVPGSGRYSVPGQAADSAKSSEKLEDVPQDQESSGWFGKLFGPETEATTEDEYEGDQLPQVAPDVPPMPPLVNTPMPREGLWVTITPTTISSSPFFDTLLVLVVSPLVTLTVVYALLLLRARIQRRRWRAPKSVVEILPVRVYHTMSSSSTSTSTHTPSADVSTANSPLLQPEQSSTLSRTRPRSRTTTSVNAASSLTLERQREDLASRYEKRKYHGRQVECVVCLEEYIDGQSQVMSLPCGHEFHAECITPWLTTRRRTCPICKGDVVKSLADGSEASFSDDAPTRSARALGSPSSRSRSESRNSRTRLLPDIDLEQGRTAARSTSRSGWRSLMNWWNGQRQADADGVTDRDR